jgi:hypothetical protein
MLRVEATYLQGCGLDVGGELLRSVGERMEGLVEHAFDLRVVDAPPVVEKVTDGDEDISTHDDSPIAI